jgi:hypothetical protein
VATYRITAWRGVPATVEAEDGRDTVVRPLSERFQMLIDAAAVQLGLDGTDAYLELWSQGEPQQREGSAAEVAEAVAAELEARFPQFVAEAYRWP